MAQKYFKNTDYVYAQYTSSTAHPSGMGTVRVEKGECWAAADPFVQANPDMFSATPTQIHTSDRKRPIVEQMTAAPGEVRPV